MKEETNNMQIEKLFTGAASTSDAAASTELAQNTARDAALARGAPECIAHELGILAARAHVLERIEGLGHMAEKAKLALQGIDQGAEVKIWLSTDVPWMLQRGRIYTIVTVRVLGSAKLEAAYRACIHDAFGDLLAKPERSMRDSNVVVNYGPVRFELVPDGVRCSYVQVGTRMKEEPVYELRCE